MITLSQPSRLRSLATLEYFLVTILSLMILALSFYPIYTRYKSTPPDRVYVGTTYYTADYAGYISNIEQGIKGRWTYTDKFTTEKLPVTLLYYPYLVLGHLGRIHSLSSIWIYHLSRFILGIIYLWLIYWLIRIIFPVPPTVIPDHFSVIPAKAGIHKNNLNRSRNKFGMTGVIKRIIAFTLVLFSSSWPIFNNSTFSVAKLSRIVAEVQVANRFVIQPHFLLGNIFLILGIILFLKYLEKPEKKYVIFSGPLVFLVTVFRPSHVILYLATIGIYILVTFLLSLRATFVKPNVAWQSKIFFLINLIFSLPGFFYLWYLKTHFPHLPYFQYDAEGRNLFSLWDWILLQGPTLSGLLIAAYLFWKKKLPENLKVLFSFMIASLFFLFILPKFYPLNPLRFLQTSMFVILAILTTEAIFKLSRNLSLITLIFLIAITISLPTLWLDFKREVNLYYDAYYIWPPQEYLPGLSYLERNSKSSDVVLTYQSLASLVPMISGNTVYWGHTNETLDYNRKQVLVEKFYKGRMSNQEAQDFLRKNKIKYVLVGREEKALGKLEYNFLENLYSNSDLVVVRVRP